jgi:large subunit ribosomal protein L4
MEGKVVSKVNLPKEVFSAKVNDSLMAQAVRVYLANQRMGTASTKNRGEITGTTKKVWRQKGTGRARHGSRKAPIFVGGGVAFGPRPRDYSLKMPKKMKKAALFSALSYKQNNGEIKFITGLEKISPKTKLMAQVVKKLGFDSKKINVLLVMPDKAKNGFENVYRAGRNIEGLKILNANAINTYEVLDNKSVLFMKDAVLAVEKHFVKGDVV